MKQCVFLGMWLASQLLQVSGFVVWADVSSVPSPLGGERIRVRGEALPFASATPPPHPARSPGGGVGVDLPPHRDFLLASSSPGATNKDAPQTLAPHTLVITNEVEITPAYFAALADEMRTNHPALRASGARLEAANANTNATRRFADPVFKLGGSVFEQRGGSAREDGDLLYGLEQRLPLFGKPTAARRVAEAEAGTQRARVEEQFQTLRRALAQGLYQTAYRERMLEIGREDLAWLETMTSATEERYRAGTASQFEALRVQNERAKRADLLLTDTRHRDQAIVGLNRLLNREVHAPWPVLRLPAVAGALEYSARLVSLAIRNEPRIKTMQREIRQAEALATATRRSRYPDVGVGLEGRQYSGDGGFREGMVTLNFSLPWLNRDKYKQDLARDEAKVKAATLDVADYEQGLREELHHLVVAIDAARREALLYQDEVIPRSELALGSAHNSWLAGRAMSLEVMEARRMLLDARMAYARAVAEQYTRLAELVLCCGLGDIEALRIYLGGPETDERKGE